jgi:hypothetical protein
MDSSGTKCGSVSGFWKHGSGSPSCDEGGEFLGRWNKHCFLCYMELLWDILHFAWLVQVHSGISGRLFLHTVTFTD